MCLRKECIKESWFVRHTLYGPKFPHTGKRTATYLGDCLSRLYESLKKIFRFFICHSSSLV